MTEIAPGRLVAALVSAAATWGAAAMAAGDFILPSIAAVAVLFALLALAPQRNVTEDRAG